MENSKNPRTDRRHQREMDVLIARTLRWGVSIACLIAAIGGGMYLAKHGAEPMKDYSTFSYTAHHDPAFTTWRGILQGLSDGNAVSWIALGVVALLLTPIVRVALSFVDFLRQRDWLYAFITATVLTVILANSVW